MKVAIYLIQFILGIVVPLLFQLWDRSRFDRAARARVWRVSTWGASLYAFGAVSLVAWGYVTRGPRFVRGLAAGFGLASAAAFAETAPAWVIAVLGGAPRSLRDDLWTAAIAMVVASAALAVVVGLVRGLYEMLRRFKMERKWVRGVGRRQTTRSPNVEE